MAITTPILLFAAACSHTNFGYYVNIKSKKEEKLSTDLTVPFGKNSCQS